MSCVIDLCKKVIYVIFDCVVGGEMSNELKKIIVLFTSYGLVTGCVTKNVICLSVFEKQEAHRE